MCLQTQKSNQGQLDHVPYLNGVSSRVFLFLFFGGVLFVFYIYFIIYFFVLSSSSSSLIQCAQIVDIVNKTWCMSAIYFLLKYVTL